MNVTYDILHVSMMYLSTGIVEIWRSVFVHLAKELFYFTSHFYTRNIPTSEFFLLMVILKLCCKRIDLLHLLFMFLCPKEYKLTLEFSINGEPRSVTVKSSRDLNSGEWQQVWIDYNEYHVRFTVNQESILVDLNDGEEFGPFEATLFIGGAPE